MEEGYHETKGVGLWGKAFTWKISGAAVEKVWGVTGDFVAVDKWMTTLVQSSQLIEGKPQTPACVRRPVLYPASPGQPFTFAIEKLLLMDEPSHYYQYTILGGTLPGFSLMKGYVSTFKLSSLTTHTSNTTCDKNNDTTCSNDDGIHTTTTTTTTTTTATTNINTCTTINPEEDATILHWSFTCHPVSTLSEQDTHNIAFSLYEAAINDLKEHLTLPDNSITLLA